VGLANSGCLQSKVFRMVRASKSSRTPFTMGMAQAMKFFRGVPVRDRGLSPSRFDLVEACLSCQPRGRDLYRSPPDAWMAGYCYCSCFADLDAA